MKRIMGQAAGAELMANAMGGALRLHGRSLLADLREELEHSEPPADQAAADRALASAISAVLVEVASDPRALRGVAEQLAAVLGSAQRTIDCLRQDVAEVAQRQGWGSPRK